LRQKEQTTKTHASEDNDGSAHDAAELTWKPCWNKNKGEE